MEVTLLAISTEVHVNGHISGLELRPLPCRISEYLWEHL